MCNNNKLQQHKKNAPQQNATMGHNKEKRAVPRKDILRSRGIDSPAPFKGCLCKTQPVAYSHHKAPASSARPSLLAICSAQQCLTSIWLRTSRLCKSSSALTQASPDPLFAAIWFANELELKLSCPRQRTQSQFLRLVTCLLPYQKYPEPCYITDITGISFHNEWRACPGRAAVQRLRD